MAPGARGLTSQGTGGWGNRWGAQCWKKDGEMLCKLWGHMMGRDPALAGDAGKGFLVAETFEVGLEAHLGTNGRGKALKGLPDCTAWH